MAKHLGALAMARARIEVTVAGDGPADDVTFLLGANAGEPALPLAKVASGGELARTMLALRLVLTEAPDTLVFDEVDAGIGGEAALAVGRSLAELGDRHQVLVVTHLAQVAAFADAQVVVRKETKSGRTVAAATAADGRGTGPGAVPDAVRTGRFGLGQRPRQRAARRRRRPPPPLTWPDAIRSDGPLAIAATAVGCAPVMLSNDGRRAPWPSTSS